MVEGVGTATDADAIAAAPRRRRLGRSRLLAGGAVLLAAAAALAVLLLVDRDDKAPAIETGVPVEVSVDELRDFAGSSDPLVYWAGPPDGQTLELTRLADASIFVRYLSAGAEIGDPRARFTTVGTYPRRRAFAETVTASRRRGNAHTTLSGGGIVVWSTSRPTSVYMAKPGTGVLVEVYDPSPERARSLVLSGDVEPVR
jgi:hypothetical protein